MPRKPTTVSIDIPSELAPALRAILDHAEGFKARARAGKVNFAEAEEQLGALVSRAEGSVLGDMLAAMDPQSERVEVGGVSYRRMALAVSENYTGLRGNVRVQRGLYRQEGVRNGPTVVPLELLAGLVEGRYTPAAARLAAALAAEMPSRSADVVCRSAGVLPHSRVSQQRVGIQLGERWEVLRPEAEAALVEAMEIPESVVSASVAVDRISLAMAEARPATAADAERNVKHPLDVNYRMAFVGAITLYDKDGEPVSTLRYAHVPEGGASAMEDSFRRDLGALRRLRPDLRVITLADGAPEMQSILDRATAGIGVEARLVDFWHLIEHLGHAIGGTERFVTDQLGDWKYDLLRDDAAIEAIETRLREWERAYTKKACPPGLHSALTYVANHRERLRYASARASGLPIGSGTVEATGKAIVQVRMKRPGARWLPAGAQAIMSLRALATSVSGRWDAAIQRLLDSYRTDVTLKKKRSKRSVANPLDSQ
jgi:hypothetical protein